MNWLNCCVKGILPASKAASTEAALSMILVVLVQWETFTSFFYTQLDEWQADDVMLSLTCLCIMSVPPLLFLELACNLEDSQHIYMLLKDMMSEWTLLRGCKALTTNPATIKLRTTTTTHQPRFLFRLFTNQHNSKPPINLTINTALKIPID